MIYRIFQGTLFILAAGFLTWVLVALRSGCDVQPTQQEFIDSAVEYYLAHNQFETSLRLIADGPDRKIRYEVYRDIEDFNATNPNCCTFSYRGQEGYMPSLIYRLRHDYAGTVEIRSRKLCEITEDGIILRHALAGGIQMNNCGQPIAESRR